MDNSTGMAVPNGYNYLGKETVASAFAQQTHFFFFFFLVLVFALKKDGKSRWIAWEKLFVGEIHRLATLCQSLQLEERGY